MKMPEDEKNSSSDQTSISFSTSSNDSGVMIIDNIAKYKGQEAFAPTKSAPGQQQQKMHCDGHMPADNSDRSSSAQINIQNFINITKTETENAKNERQRKQLQPAPSKNRRHSSKSASPAVSIRSTTISIVSIDENEIDSSVVESDSEVEADANNDQYIVKKLGRETTYEPNSPDIPNVGRDMIVLSQKISPNGATDAATLPQNLLRDSGGLGQVSNVPQIGSIALSNSTDVTFGDKHFYEGPVTIQQFLIDSRKKWKPANGHEDQEGQGQDNPFFNQYNEFKQAEVDPSCVPNVPPKHPLLPYGFVFNRKAAIITVVIILSILLIGVLIITASNLSAAQKIPTEEDEIFNGTLHVVKRDEWMGALPKSGMDRLNLPVHRIIISHTASETCSNSVECSFRLQAIQYLHMKSWNWDDIGYNFLIGANGLVYIGRGWDIQGAHTKGYNVDSIGISFIGTFMTVRPTMHQLTAAQLLIDEGVRLGKVVPNYRLYGARQLSGTESPGDSLYSIIQTWSHWSSTI